MATGEEGVILEGLEDVFLVATAADATVEAAMSSSIAVEVLPRRPLRMLPPPPPADPLPRVYAPPLPVFAFSRPPSALPAALRLRLGGPVGGG